MDLTTLAELKQVNKEEVKRALGQDNQALSDSLIRALTKLSLND